MASTYKTRTELQAELVQLLEELKSGSLVSGSGVNRPLERLAQNIDVLLDLAQTRGNSVLTGGGTWAFSGTSLTWSSAFQVRWPGVLGSVSSNAVLAGNANLSSSGAVAYLVLDRSTDGATTTVAVAASMAAFLALLAASTARADYLLIAYRSGSHVVFADGRRLLAGQSLTGDGSTDTQYAQQAAFAAVQLRLPQNLNIILTGGGQLSWDQSANRLTWSDVLNILIPGNAAGNQVAADDAVIPAGSVLYVTLNRSTGSGGGEAGPTLSPAVATYAAYTQTNDTLVLAFRHSDGRIYLWNGQSLGDGDVAALGGTVSGVQWFFADAGDGLQVTDFTEGGAFPTRSYPVGTHALMVYRNGVKQKASAAYWDGGTYPGSGSLNTTNGSITAADDYLEENSGDSTGTRILWLRDTDSPNGDETSELTYRSQTDPPPGGVASGSAHDPSHTWPSSSHRLEAFIGVQGQGPSPVESISISGDPGDPLDGDVQFLAGNAIELTYVGGKIRIAVTATAGVTSLEVDGGTEGAQGGALTLSGGTGIALDDSTPGTIVITLSASLDDLTGVSSDLAAAVTGAESPSASNPLLSAVTIAALQGFDQAWSDDGTNVRTAGGALTLAGSTSLHATDDLVQANATSNVFPSDTLVVNNWLYSYVTHNAGVAKLVLASSPPSRATAFGRHPGGGGAYAFLTSCYYDGSGYIYPFVKRGTWVDLGRQLDVSTAFTSAVGTPTAGFAWVTVTPAPLPHTAGGVVRLRLRVPVASPTTTIGYVYPLYVRPKNAVGYRKHVALLGAKVLEEGIAAVDCDFVEFEFDAQLDKDGSFDISLPDTLYTGSPSAWLCGYAEARASAADDVMEP